MNVKELYASVTATIIRDLEAGVPSWIKPWKSKSGDIMSHNAVSKRSYNGINVPILWHAQQENGYTTAAWLTYKQAQASGAQVKGGEKSTRVVFAKQLTIKDDADVEKQIGMLRTFAVFNASQIEGLPVEEPHAPLTDRQRDDAAIRFIQATKADIRHGGDRACYVPSKDFITLPHTTDFETYEHYLATALHECIHWSGHPSRLNRDLKHRFDTRSYAAEELVAELGAAFLCAHLEVKGQLRHAEYIANWLQLLRDDDRAVFTAASKASQAADYLRAFSQEVAEAA